MVQLKKTVYSANCTVNDETMCVLCKKVTGQNNGLCQKSIIYHEINVIREENGRKCDWKRYMYGLERERNYTSKRPVFIKVVVFTAINY